MSSAKYPTSRDHNHAIQAQGDGPVDPITTVVPVAPGIVRLIEDVDIDPRTIAIAIWQESGEPTVMLGPSDVSPTKKYWDHPGGRDVMDAVSAALDKYFVRSTGAATSLQVTQILGS